MSKAFTKESDAEPSDEPLSPRASASLPPGTPNYLTPGGAQRLRGDLERLQAERQSLPENAERGSEPWSRRRRLQRQMSRIEEILESAQVLPPPATADERQKVVFGARVTVRELGSGERSVYHIVGVDEVDLGEDLVSLHAPVARALINRRVGEEVRFRFPAGEETLRISSVEYDDPASSE